MAEEKAAQKDKYEQIAKLGEGAFGKVYQVRSKLTGSLFVIKKVPMREMNRDDRDKVKNESNVLMKLNHPNIIKF